MSTPEGSSLVAPTTLNVSWGETLPGNAAFALNHMYNPQLTLSGYDPATQFFPLGGGAVELWQTVIQPGVGVFGPTGFTLNVVPTTAPAWMLEMTYPGPFVEDAGDQGDLGVCFMKIRKFFSK
jgi:hypothetical protein